MKIKPLHDWAIIKISEPEEKTAAGIIIPEIAKEEPSEGIVVAIGPGRYRIEKGRMKFIPTTLRPGQRVIFLKYTAQEVELDGEVITLVREEDILGTSEETQLIERKPFEVEVKHERPVVLKEEAKGIPAVTPSKKTTVKKKAVTKKKAVSKTVKPALKTMAKKAPTKATKKVELTRKKAKTPSKKTVKKKTTPLA
jgi:chaperonin GroES